MIPQQQQHIDDLDNTSNAGNTGNYIHMMLVHRHSLMTSEQRRHRSQQRFAMSYTGYQFTNIVTR